MENRILNCDCVEGVRSLETGSVPLVVTSPPYDKLMGFAAFNFESLAHELYRAMLPGGVVVWVVGDQIVTSSETGTSFRQALHFKEIGFNLATMIFDPKGRANDRRGRYGNAMQFMFVLSKGPPRVFQPIYDKRNRCAGQIRKPRPVYRGRGAFNNQRPIRTFGRRGNVWSYPVGGTHTTADKLAYDHPAIFPEALARDHILTWSKPGELVLDVFAGAGTTAKMSILTGRKFLGFEINPVYCELAERRVREAILRM